MEHQATFRVLLNAMNRPGEICRLPVASGSVEIVKTVSQTLFDHEVTFALAGQAHPLFSANDVILWTHAKRVAASEADFLIITGPDGHSAISQLRRGSPEMPDTGATVFFLLSETMDANKEPKNHTLTGPGIPPPGRRPLPTMALANDDIEALQEANEEFPMGVDCFFLDPEGAIVGLPRSVTIRRRS
jgi:alpha-D-ribose 1-methylphosphonate 5-triphosphate synthase subunit PhnH